jgi:hypothetical protein
MENMNEVLHRERMRVAHRGARRSAATTVDEIGSRRDFWPLLRRGNSSAAH